MATAKIIHPDDEELFGVHRLAWADHVVPPSDIAGGVSVITGDVMVPRQRMADQDRIGFVVIQLAIRFIHQIVTRQHRAAAKYQRGVKRCALCADYAYIP